MPIDKNLIDVFPVEHDGYPDILAAEDTPDALFSACGDAARAFPQSLWVPANERKEMAEENDRNKTWGYHRLDRMTHQGNSHECSAHAVTRSAECAWNRQRGIIYPEGPKKEARYEESKLGSVWFSPLSLYIESNPRRWGGSNIAYNMNIAQRRGFLPDKTQPTDYGLRHTLHGTAGGRSSMNQSDGPWVSLKNLPSGWQETAKHFRPLEVVIVEDWEQALSLLLHGYVLAYGRRGHAIPPSFWDHKEDVVGIVDSYLRITYDSMSTFRSASRGAVCIMTMTTPDDWAKPAG